MTTQNIYAIEEEYGVSEVWMVCELFSTREAAEEMIEFLANLNKGINYRIAVWAVN